MEKMRMASADMTAQYIDKIAELFPNCITESVDSKGNRKRAINFDMLKQMLADDVLDGDEAYEFTWVGKKAAMVEANKPITKTLRPCPEESVHWDTTQNLYIEGDNLEVLKLLQESYLGKVKMIYIDPPYNTGSDFIYNDDFKMTTADYADESGEYDDDGNRLFKNTDSNGRFHSDWCSMMYSRLMLARHLLSDDGVIFISIDDNEQANLKKICDEVFGESNFVGMITWIKKTKPINSGKTKYQLQKKIEYVFVYSKSEIFFNLRKNGERIYNQQGKLGLCRFKDILDSDIGRKSRDTMKFPILGITPSDGQRWKIGKDEIEKLLKSNRVEVIDGKIKIAVYPQDESSEILKPFWSHIDDTGSAEDGKKLLNETLSCAVGFDTVKPINLLKELIFAATNKDSLILDFFSGSATTAHAVMQLNAEDGGNRQFIMVQLPEKMDEKSEAYKAGYKNICEIGKERIRRATQKIAEENPDKSFDSGFRVLKVADSNMTDVFYHPEEYTQDLIDKLELNIKPDRSNLDLLFGCLIDWGLPLSMPYHAEQIEGYTVHNYNDGDLIACFDEDVPESVVKAIAKHQPLRAVFRDSSFANSPAKINAGEIFKLYAPNTSVKVI